MVTKLNNETFQFLNQVLIANKNLEAIYSIVECSDYIDIISINKMILKEDDLIVRINL